MTLRRSTFVYAAVALGAAAASSTFASGCRRSPSVLGDCAEEETRCNGDAVETCSGGSWGTAVPCGAGESCSIGACGAATACVDDCTTAGATVCAGGATVTCGEFDSDACRDLGSPVACPAGETCSNGACAATCTDECTGGTSCAGPGAEQSCDNYDADDCLDWGGLLSCPAGFSCVSTSGSGACMMVECTDDCDPVGFQWTCVPDGGYTDCVTNGDADPCYEMVAVPCSMCNGPTPVQCAECCG